MNILTRYGCVTALAFFLVTLSANAGDLGREDYFKERTSILEECLFLINTQEEKIGSDVKLNVNRIEACKVLGEIRSKAAISALIKQMVDLIDWSTPTEALPSLERAFPSVSALIQIGKPASLACLEEIAKTVIPAVPPKDSAQDPKFRIELLTMVISGVETPKIAEFMLKKRMEKATEVEKQSLGHALVLVQQQLKNHP